MKRRRFNEKARQGKAVSVKGGQAPPDTNYTVLIPRTNKSCNEEKADQTSRTNKRLSSRQKKKLKAVIENKRKKEKRAAIINSLQSMSLSSSEMKLLHRSTDLSKNKLTAKELIERGSVDIPPLINNSFELIEENGCGPNIGNILINKPGGGGGGGVKRRKQRKRRRHLVEKRILEPRELKDSSSDVSSSEEEEESEETTSHHELMETEQEEGTISTDGHCASNESSCLLSSPDPPSSSLPSSSAPPISAPPPATPAVYVSVNRSGVVQSSRLSLPILSEEHSIIAAVKENPVVIICGETGSGKTTQVPQFLYESGHTLLGAESGKRSIIGITEPRRVAAVSMATRVGYEMDLPSSQVSYQIRYEGTVSQKTEIKFMTDGVLLKEIEKDFLLSNYSVLIIDEAHERSVYSDILIGLLSRIVPLRNKSERPLKLIIMSATLRVKDFTENHVLFPTPPPVVKVESRQFPVTVHFNRVTPLNYVLAAYRKVCKIHSSLPGGHILVFLTGRQEILQLVKKLEATFPSSSLRPPGTREEEEEEYKDLCLENRDKLGERERRKDSYVNLDDYPILSEDVLANDSSCSDHSDSDSNEEAEFISVSNSNQPLVVLPLYSTLEPEEQAKVFGSDVMAVSSRVCIVATNVAETSITIPNVKYVVDTGKVKRKYYDSVTGVSTLKVDWVSKASANQRAGRAGRTEPGHCYRLYSSAVFQNNFIEFSEPDVTQQPVDGLVLQMKAMNIIKVINFPFPTPPSKEALKAAEDLLVHLGAIDSERLAITSVGRTMASLPVSPSFAKMISLSHQNGCLPYMVILVSALSVREIFQNEIDKKWTIKGEGRLLGDLMVLLGAVQGYERALNRNEYCKMRGLRIKAMDEIRKLRRQLTNTINGISGKGDLSLDPNLALPTSEQVKVLRQLVLAGSPNKVARKIDTSRMNVEEKKKYHYGYECQLTDSPVYLPSSSSLCLSSPLPQFVVFQELHETTRLYMRNVSVIEAEWLPWLLPARCVFSDPLEDPLPTFNTSSGRVYCHMKYSFGSWQLGVQSFPYPTDSLERYKWFAVFLLKGEVAPGFSQFTDSLLTPPITMVKSWAKLHKRTQVLLSSLVENEVSSRQELMNIWKTDPKYLLSHLAMWLPQRLHSSLSEKWSSIVNSTLE
ncbi:PREDICTED: probable ATP-dependent RNA helicase DHX37 [Amphimedon queenslandica]|uniref:RNA helicase n=1 Tax=Amphimedon queenslandica TaxID=400682 RepID=A0A1X7VHF4_AMPQE|nr:PREDICTED: probable ATP-dependent RNA helicase DHX37 [Amphimedon queenslandica]|eukprot:XP_011410152.2 PREDICTED: probable ATP-dependent RNA helicase DHX37 [Amphimedon queenslandica]